MSNLSQRRFLVDVSKKHCCFAIVLAIAAIICPAFPSSLKGDVIGNPAKLEAIINAYQANQQALKTWHGTAEIRTQANSPGTGERETTAEVDFSFDQSGDSPAFSFFWRYLSSVRVLDEKRLENEYADVRMGGFMRNGILTSYGPFETGRKNVVQNVKTAPDEPKKLGGMSDFFDPRMFFGVNEEPLDQFLERKRENIATDWAVVDISQKNSIVRLSTSNKTIPGIKPLFEFDLTQGGNLLHIDADEPSRHIEVTRTYERVEDVWVPKKSIYDNRSKDEKEYSRREVTFHTLGVNTPLPEKAFTLEGIGVLPNARVTDVGAMATTVFEPTPVPEKSLIDRSNSIEKKPQVPQAGRTRSLLIIVNLLVLAVIGAVVLFRIVKK